MRGSRLQRPIAASSANALPTEETMHPSPTGTNTASGTSGAKARAISSAAVFLPSTSRGLWAQLRLYQPCFAITCRDRSKAWS